MKQTYINPTEEIDLRIFTKIKSPIYDEQLSRYIIVLKSRAKGIFKFSHPDQEKIQDWYHEINRSIHANNDNLICTMLSDDILINNIASYIEGYKRFQIFPCINKYFRTLFNINNFDYYGVYFTDSMYFTQHFNRFYNENENSFAIKQGLYRSFYNPEKKYMDIHINRLQSKQLLYLLISYGPLLDGAKRYDKAQKEKYKKMKEIEKMLILNGSPTQKANTQRQKDHALDLDLDKSLDMKQEEEEEEHEQEEQEEIHHHNHDPVLTFDDDETKDDDTNDTNNASYDDHVHVNINSNTNTNIIELHHKTPTSEQKDEIMFEYEYNERKYTKMECINYK